MKALAISIVLVLSSPLALAADESYRSVMPDGSIRYGAAPEPGAKQVKKIPAPPAKTGTIVITNQEKNNAERIRTPEGSAAVMPPQARESPRPRPVNLVVKNGSKIFSCVSLLMPHPLSVTSICT